MKQIEFRGLGELGNWYYGSLVISKRNNHGVIDTEASTFIVSGHNQYSNDPVARYFDSCVIVRPETVGKYTGFKDIHGYKMYEDDICVSTDDENVKTVIVFVEEWGMFASLLLGQYEEYHSYLKDGIGELDEAMFWCYPITGSDHEVIGNIHLNPELIK